MSSEEGTIEPGEKAVPKPDRWSIWFTRAVQAVGLIIVVTEQAAVLFLGKKPEPWLLLVAVAMMLGGLGLRMILRGASGIIAENGTK